METIVNWDTDWSDCFLINPKRDKLKKCNACGEDHDIKCFFRHHGSYLGCMINKSSRSKAMAKIKGGAGAKR